MIKTFGSILFYVLLGFLIGCTPGDKGQGLSHQSLSHTQTPESQGISSRAILDFIEAAERERKDELHSFIILRHGYNVAEGYWAPYNAESNHRLFSLSKSFTSTAIGLAQEESLLSIDDRVISFFPEAWPDSVSPNLKSMRIRDLLRMNTGHNQDVTGSVNSAESNWAQRFLSLPVEHKPGTHFVYNTSATFMMSAIIQKVTGKTLLEYLTSRLFEPLEISNPTWDLNPDSINVGGWGLKIRTRDIANFGQLYLQKGKWDGEQLIPEAWIEEATSLQTCNGSNPESDWEQGYGYQFWRCRNNMYRGDGAFGQYCIVMPEQDAVIAITSGTSDMPAILNLVWDYLLPAFKEDALPEDRVNYQAMTDKLGGLALSTVEGEESSAVAQEISNYLFTMEPNVAGIESILFELTGEEKNIAFTSVDETLILPVGYKANKKGSMLFPRYGKQPVASSGAWISDHIYQVRMYYYETPFYMSLDFEFGDGNVIVAGDLNVSFGSREFLRLKGIRQ